MISKRLLLFLLQTWEAMYRMKIEMCLAYKENGNKSTSKFDEKEFLKEIADIMSIYLKSNKDCDL